MVLWYYGNKIWYYGIIISHTSYSEREKMFGSC